MNTPETINIEKYAEALNNLVGMDIGYLGDSDDNVNAIVEVIRAAKALENRVKELETESQKWQEAYDCADAACRELSSKCDELTEEIKDLEEEYDRVYEQAEADIHGNMADGGTSCHWCIDKTREDTVKRMCKRIEEESWYEVLYEEERCLIDVDDINLIAKELLEEK